MSTQSCETQFFKANAAPDPGYLRDAKDCDEWAQTDMSRNRAIKQRYGGVIARLVDRFGVDKLLEAGLVRLTSTPNALLARLGLVAPELGLIGAINGYVPNGPRDPYNNPCAPYQGNSVHEGDPGCPPRQICGEDSWPIRTRTLSNFPVVGNGSFASAVADVKPSQNNLVPTRFWAAFYDSAIASQPRIHGEVVNVSIGNTTQFLGEGQGTRVYEDLSVGVAVQWDTIYASIGAKFDLGHSFANTVTMQAYLTVWGLPNVTPPQ